MVNETRASLKSGNISGESQRRILTLSAILLLIACYTPSRYIEYDAQRNRMTRIPSFIGTGDSVFLVVKDSVYGNRYASKTDTVAVVLADRAALFGGVDLAKLAAGIPDQILDAVPTIGVAGPMSFNDLNNKKDSVARQLSKECQDSLDQVTGYLLLHPDDFRVVSFLLDENVKRLADSVSHDPLLSKVDALISLGYASRLRYGAIDSLQADAADYSRKVAMLGLMGGAGGTPNRAELRKQLRSLQPCIPEVVKTRIREVKVDSSQSVVGGSPGDTSQVLSVAGLDLTSLVVPTEADAKRSRELYGDLMRIALANARITAAINQLPVHAVTTRADTVYVGTYWRPVRLKVSPVRNTRFREYAATVPINVGDPTTKPDSQKAEKKPEEAGKQPVANKPSETITLGTLSVTVSTGTASRDSAAASPKAAVTAPALPIAEVDVLQRNRFRLGVGVMRSRLATKTYSSNADTVGGVPGMHVETTGSSPSKTAPIATLAYSIFPLEGKVYGAQAYVTTADSASRGILDYLYQAGLSATLGLSLTDPLEQVFFGFETEPVPGINFGLGWHYGHVSVSRADSTGFLSNKQGDPLRKQWKHAGAWEINFDPAVIINSIGKLIGLK